ncbi:transcriptional regulator ATRX homolog [Rhopilema esculentum]|uniref:transcriptional regulator ATRX homolog n=1 Tax=Rhopilema esculentum TaxID=499914 RepID=UPI0031DC76F1|eukprot:gene34-9636_t
MENAEHQADPGKPKKGIKLLSILDKLRSNAKADHSLDCKGQNEDDDMPSDRVPNSKAAANNATDSETVSKNSFVKISSSSIVDLVSEPGDAGNAGDAGDKELPVYDDSEAITVVPLDEEGLYEDVPQNNNVEDIATVSGHEMPKMEDDPAEPLQNIEESRESEATSHLSRLPSHIKCTGCGEKLKTHKVLQHPVLGVLICKACSKFYNSSSFSRDKFGMEEYCKWCGDGGDLICCDFCEKVFCQKCVKRNMGEEFLKILLAAEEQKWKCFSCDPSQIVHFTDECKSIIKLIKKIKMAGYAFENKKTHLGGPSQLERKDRLLNITQTLEDAGVAAKEVKIEIDPDIANLIQKDVNDICVIESEDTQPKVNKKGLAKVQINKRNSKENLKTLNDTSRTNSFDNDIFIMDNVTENFAIGRQNGTEDNTNVDQLLHLKEKFSLKDCNVLLERAEIPTDILLVFEKQCSNASLHNPRNDDKADRHNVKSLSLKQNGTEREVPVYILSSGNGNKEKTEVDTGEGKLCDGYSKPVKKSTTTKDIVNQSPVGLEGNVLGFESESDESDFKPDSENTEDDEEEVKSEEDETDELDDSQNDRLHSNKAELDYSHDLSDASHGKGSSESEFDYQRIKNRSIRSKGRKTTNENRSKAVQSSSSQDSSDDKRKSDSSSNSLPLSRGAKRKRKGFNSSKGTESSESLSDAAHRTKKRTRRRRKVLQQSSESEDSKDDDSDEDKDEEEKAEEEGTGKKGKRKSGLRGRESKAKRTGKGQKRKGKILSSDSDESSDDKSKSKRKGRRNIRRILAEEELTEETRKARQLEEDRRRRLLERTQATYEEEQALKRDSVTGTLILERDKKTGKALVEVHHSLVTNLKPHQVEGIQFMYDCLFESLEKFKNGEKGSGALLAHCMGLGKSLQIITLLHTVANHPEMKLNKFLVVAPLNTVYNWETEFEKWLELDERMDVHVLSDSGHNMKLRLNMLRKWYSHGGVMILGYDMYRNLTQFRRIRNKKHKKIITETLLDPGPDIVVCDEGHVLRNDLSAISQALTKIKTLRRVVLTGTPLQNNLLEYFVMVSFVKPNLLGTKKEFTNIFMNPIANGQCSNSTPADVKIMKQRCHVLHDTLSGCVQRKDYSVLTPLLTPKHEYTIFVRLGERQRKMYQFYLDSFVCGNLADVRARGTGIFADYQCLMKIWTHPWAVKLEAIRRLEREALDDIRNFLDDSESESESSAEEKAREPGWKSSGSETEPRMASSAPKSPTNAGEMDTGNSVETGPHNHQPHNSMQDRISHSLRSKNSNSAATLANDSNKITLKEGKSELALDSNVFAVNDTDESSSDDECPKENMVTVKPGEEPVRGMGSTRSGTRFKDATEMEEEVEIREWYDDFIDEGDDTNVELSGKLVLLLEILADAEIVGDKLLVFSQSLVSLDLIERALGGGKIGGNEMSWCKGVDYFRLDGSTPAKTRQRFSEIFNDVDNTTARLFLISTRAGSLGVNLVAANRVIVFDCSWNPSHDVQSIFRVYRFGQDKPVYVYRFVSQGTMEQKIYERQINKLALSGRVVDEQQISRHFTDEELRELYVFNAEEYKEGDDTPVPQLPADPLLAEVLQRQHPKWIVKYQEHDILLENVEEEQLTEEERRQAWASYEEQKDLAKNAFAKVNERMRIAQERMQTMQQQAQLYREMQLQHQHQLLSGPEGLSQQNQAMRTLYVMRNPNQNVSLAPPRSMPVTSLSSEERFRNLQMVALAGMQSQRLPSWRPRTLPRDFRPNITNTGPQMPPLRSTGHQVIDLSQLEARQVRPNIPTMHPSRSAINLPQGNNLRFVNLQGSLPRSASVPSNPVSYVPRRT